MNFIGTCADKELVEYLFGSVIEFTQTLQEKGNDFGFKGIPVSYDKGEDLHYFYSWNKKSDILK